MDQQPKGIRIADGQVQIDDGEYTDDHRKVIDMIRMYQEAIRQAQVLLEEKIMDASDTYILTGFFSTYQAALLNIVSSWENDEVAYKSLDAHIWELLLDLLDKLRLYPKSDTSSKRK